MREEPSTPRAHVGSNRLSPLPTKTPEWVCAGVSIRRLNRAGGGGTECTRHSQPPTPEYFLELESGILIF